MRIAFIGASETAVLTATLLGDRGHEVIIVEQNKETIQQLSEDLDCSFLHGDGAHPDVLEETSPKQTDVLLCLTDDDKDNLVAALVGRSLGFKRVIVSIGDPKFEGICKELGLESTIIPNRIISGYLADMVDGADPLSLTAAIKDEARLFTFKAGDQDEGTVTDLKLPDGARVICCYRDGEFALADGDTRLQQGDEVVILSHSRHRKDFEERWPAENSNGDDRESKS